MNFRVINTIRGFVEAGTIHVNWFASDAVINTREDPNGSEESCE